MVLEAIPSLPIHSRQPTDTRAIYQASDAMNPYIPYNRTYQSDREKIVETLFLPGPIICIKTIPDPCLADHQVHMQM
jgi:hypothetical protein